MNKVKFSVLLSIYYKEKPEYFSECMESIYSQTVLPDEIVAGGGWQADRWAL